MAEMQEMPEQESAEVAPQGSEDPMKLVKDTSQNLATIIQVIASMPDVDPADIAEGEDIIARFQALMEKMAGGGASQQAAPKPQGPRAVPMQSMQGKPVSPAGM